MVKEILLKYWATIASLLLFVVYMFTIAPGVVEIDSGELAAVQITFGIAHPTGYPLFTVAGYLFSLIPLPVSKIFQANILAAVYCATAFYFVCKALYVLADHLQPNKEKAKNSKKGRKKTKENRPLAKEFTKPFKIFTALIGGFSLAFSTTFWLQSTSVEVYSFHLLIVSIIIYSIVKLSNESDNTFGRDWIVIAAMFGMGFANHMSTIMLVPSALFILVLHIKNKRISYAALFKCALVFALIVVISYSILLIRAGFDPVLNWGNPENLENLWRHISGKQYQVWLFSSIDVAKQNIVNFFGSLVNEFGIPLLLLSLAGVFHFYGRHRIIFVFLTVNFLFTVIYASNYDIKDLQTYYLLALISISFFIYGGAIKALKILAKYKNGYKSGFVTIAIIIVLQVSLNFGKVNQQDVFIFEDYTKALMGSTDKNSIVFSYQWDYFLSASYYYQFVENYRKDVIVIDKELLRRSWYYDQLRNITPKIFNGFEDDVQEFLSALKPFERGGNYDAGKLETYFQRIMTNLVKFNSDQYSFYIGPELVENEMRRGQFSLPGGFSIVPDLLLFKVVKGNDYHPAPAPDFTIRKAGNPNEYHKFIESLCAKMLIYRTMYEIQHDKEDRARLYAEKVLTDFPGIPLPENIKKKLSL